MITCLSGKPRLFFWTLGYVAQTPSDWLHGSKFLSFPWGLLLKPGHQHLGPTQFDGHGDKHFGLRGLVGTNLCVEFSLLCPLHTSWCALLQGFKASLVSASKMVSKYAETFPLSKLPSGFLCLSFLFCFRFLSTFLSFLEVWGLLPAFKRCSIGIIPHVEVFFMYLLYGRQSPHLTPRLFWSLPTLQDIFWSWRSNWENLPIDLM